VKGRKPERRYGQLGARELVQPVGHAPDPDQTDEPVTGWLPRERGERVANVADPRRVAPGGGLEHQNPTNDEEDAAGRGAQTGEVEHRAPEARVGDVELEQRAEGEAGNGDEQVGARADYHDASTTPERASCKMRGTPPKIVPRVLT